jgi:di/tricarboxylate transporter
MIKNLKLLSSIGLIMTNPEQWIVFGTLILTLTLFIIGKIRYDIVALIALLILVITGPIPSKRAFTGFSNPAVITVAAVFVLSRALQNSGVVDLIGQQLAKVKGGIVIQLSALTGIVVVFSAFMNNVGALALLLPVAIQLAKKKNVSPSTYLMPIAFASLLGGMTTLIGTPPNIIISSFREQAGLEPFRMFDFSLVGVGVAVIGVIYIVLLGWRLIPVRKGQSSTDNLFDIEKYVTEVRITETSKLNGRKLSEFHTFVESEVMIIALVRGVERRLAPSPQTKFTSNDVLILTIDTENLDNLIATSGVELVGSEKIDSVNLESDEIALMETVVTANSMMIGGNARTLNLRKNYGVNLLAIARQGRRLQTRLDRIRFQSGDVLLLQGYSDTLKEVLATLGCLPLANRGLRIGQPRRILFSLVIFASALTLSAIGLLSVQVAFIAACVIMVLTKLISLKDVYESIEWPIIILLGAMIPVGEALETTGGASLIANGVLSVSHQMAPEVSLVIMLVATMFLSDIINNAAAVVLMAPIGINIANGLGVSIDPFLMATAIGASCAFLTPIGHLSNTLVMGPGGYKFGDYWKIGLISKLLLSWFRFH